MNFETSWNCRGHSQEFYLERFSLSPTRVVAEVLVTTGYFLLATLVHANPPEPSFLCTKALWPSVWQTRAVREPHLLSTVTDDG